MPTLRILDLLKQEHTSPNSVANIVELSGIVAIIWCMVKVSFYFKNTVVSLQSHLVTLKKLPEHI